MRHLAAEGLNGIAELLEDEARSHLGLALPSHDVVCRRARPIRRVVDHEKNVVLKPHDRGNYTP